MHDSVDTSVCPHPAIFIQVLAARSGRTTSFAQGSEKDKAALNVRSFMSPRVHPNQQQYKRILTSQPNLSWRDKQASATPG
jgi:hypothetical protein